MKFCNKCGNEIVDGKSFCTVCGNGVKSDTTNEKKLDYDEDLDDVTAEESVPSNFKLSKKSKIAMMVLAILIIATIVVIKVGNSLSDPNKVVIRFQQDVANNNTSDLADILYSKDVRLKVDSKSIAPLLAYFKSNPSYLNEVVESLKSDAFNTKDIIPVSVDPNNMLTLIKQGKKLFIFPNYKINIKPAFVNITTTVKDVSFSVNNVLIGKSDSDEFTKEFGPYIPGNYSVLANYKGQFLDLSKSYPVDFVLASNGKAELSVFDDLSYLNITSDHIEADIFVNGKNINMKVKDATKLGPIDGSAKIYATCMIDGKVLKSDEELVSNGYTDMYLSFENSINEVNEVQSKIKELLGNYTYYFTQAVNTNNVSLINNYVAAGTELYKQQEAFIPTTYAAGTSEEVISSDITEYKVNDDNKSGSITTSEDYIITYKDGTSSNKHFAYVYEFKYNESYGFQFTSIKLPK